METVADYHNTLPELIDLAHSQYVLQDFMNHNHVSCRTDKLNGSFKLVLRISPHVWAPVRWELEKQAQQILQKAYQSFAPSNRLGSAVELFYDDKSARSLDWQIDALKRHLFDGIPMLVKHGVGAWEKTPDQNKKSL